MLKRHWCAGCEGEVQAGLLERIRCRAGVLAGLPGSQLLEGPCAASIAGREHSLLTGRHFSLLVRLLHLSNQASDPSLPSSHLRCTYRIYTLIC